LKKEEGRRSIAKTLKKEEGNNSPSLKRKKETLKGEGPSLKN